MHKGEESNLKATGSAFEFNLELHTVTISPRVAAPVFANIFFQTLFIPIFISFSFKLLLIVFTKLYMPNIPVTRLKKFGGMPNFKLKIYINATKPQF